MSITEHQRPMNDADAPGPEADLAVAPAPAADVPTVASDLEVTPAVRRPGYASQLSKARVAQQVSVDELFRRTRIRPAIIEAVERGDTAAAGGIVYARGHVRSLANALGVDAGPLIGSFDHAHRDQVSKVPVLTADVGSPPPVDGRRRRGGNRPASRWTWLAVVVLIAVIAVALVALLVPDKDEASVAPSKAATPSTQVKPKATKPTTQPKPVETLPEMVFPAPAQGVTVRMVLPFLPSWLSATNQSGVTLLSGNQPSSYKAIDLHADAGIRLTVGDASAIAISCNGKPLPRPLGAPNQVLTLDLYRGNALCPAA